MLDVAILMCHNHSFLKDKRQMNPNEKLLNRTAVCRNNKENHPKSNPVNVSYIFIVFKCTEIDKMKSCYEG